MTTTTAPSTAPNRPSGAKRAQHWLANHIAMLSAILVLLVRRSRERRGVFPGRRF